MSENFACFLGLYTCKYSRLKRFYFAHFPSKYSKSITEIIGKVSKLFEPVKYSQNSLLKSHSQQRETSCYHSRWMKHNYPVSFAFPITFPNIHKRWVSNALPLATADRNHARTVEAFPVVRSVYHLVSKVLLRSNLKVDIEALSINLREISLKKVPFNSEQLYALKE